VLEEVPGGLSEGSKEEKRCRRTFSRIDGLERYLIEHPYI